MRRGEQGQRGLRERGGGEKERGDLLKAVGLHTSTTGVCLHLSTMPSHSGEA